MTLATLALYRGLAEGVSQARSVRGYPEWFFTLGQGDVLGVPTQLWIWAAAILVCAVVLARTTVGRTLYAMASTRPPPGSPASGRGHEARDLHLLGLHGRSSPPGSS